MHIDLKAVVVGQKLAVQDYSGNRATFKFCTATRVTKQFVEVTGDKPNVDKSIDVSKFSKTTGKMLQGASWERHKHLVLASYATDAIARQEAMNLDRIERYEIKQALLATVNGFWDVEAVAKLRALADRMEKAIQ